MAHEAGESAMQGLDRERIQQEILEEAARLRTETPKMVGQVALSVF